MARMNKEEMMAMAGKELVALADSMGVKVAANKERTALKEAKAKVVDRLLAAMPEEEEVEERPVMKVDGFTADEVAAMPEAEEQEVAEAPKKVRKPRKEDPEKAGFEEVFHNLMSSYNYTEKVWEKIPNLVAVREGKKTIAEVYFGKKGYRVNVKADRAERVEADFDTIKNYYLPACLKNIPYTNTEVLVSLFG